MITAKLTEKIIIKQATTSATTEGIPTEVWKPIKVIAGSITNQRGNLDLDNGYQGETYTENVSFYCRYSRFIHEIMQSNFRKTLRVEWNCKEYEVLNISPISRNVASVWDLQGVS